MNLASPFLRIEVVTAASMGVHGADVLEAVHEMVVALAGLVLGEALVVTLAEEIPHIMTDFPTKVLQVVVEEGLGVTPRSSNCCGVKVFPACIKSVIFPHLSKSNRYSRVLVELGVGSMGFGIPLGAPLRVD